MAHEGLILCVSSRWLHPCSAPFLKAWPLLQSQLSDRTLGGCICDKLSAHARCMLKSSLLVPLLWGFMQISAFPGTTVAFCLCSSPPHPPPRAVIEQKEKTLFRLPYDGLRMLFAHMKGLTSVRTSYRKKGLSIWLWYPEASAALSITSDPPMNISFLPCLQWAKVTAFRKVGI